MAHMTRILVVIEAPTISIILYYTIPYYTIPYHTIPYYTIFYFTKLQDTIPYHTIYYMPICYILYTKHYMLYTIYYIQYTIYCNSYKELAQAGGQELQRRSLEALQAGLLEPGALGILGGVSRGGRR